MFRRPAVRYGKTPEPEEAEMFSRGIQTGAGLLTGIVGVGAGIGAVFRIVRDRRPGRGPG